MALEEVRVNSGSEIFHLAMRRNYQPLHSNPFEYLKSLGEINRKVSLELSQWRPLYVSTCAGMYQNCQPIVAYGMLLKNCNSYILCFSNLTYDSLDFNFLSVIQKFFNRYS